MLDPEDLDGFIHLYGNKYLRKRTERLYYAEEQYGAGSTRLVHEIYYEIDDGRIVDFRKYQEYLVFGKVLE
jgi:hypothetical protein